MKCGAIPRCDVYHIVREVTEGKRTAKRYSLCGTLIYSHEMGPIRNDKHLCKKCKQSFIKQHSEEELFLEMV